jgi:hypothetical protein
LLSPVLASDLVCDFLFADVWALAESPSISDPDNTVTIRIGRARPIIENDPA